MKAQVSSEFLVVFSALLLIFVVVFTIFFGGNLNLDNAQDSAASQRNAQSAAAAMNFVYLAGDGASYNYSLTGLEETENITMSGFSVTSEGDYTSASSPLLDGKMNSSRLEEGKMVISNEAGEIYVRR
jgi:uncharacterized protein (UPF0333 family)